MAGDGDDGQVDVLAAKKGLHGYRLGRELGSGSFAETRIAQTEAAEGMQVAVKSVRKNNPRFDYHSLEQEIAIMRAIKHPHCCALVDVREDDSAVHFILELLAGGELFDRIIEMGRFSEKDAVFFVRQIADGVQYLHSMGCIHRDLKPENILMVGGDPDTAQYMQLKLIDFGLSAMRDQFETKADFDKNLQIYMGTDEYLAPEVYQTASKQTKGHYTGKIDVWAIGCIHYIMMCGQFPFTRDECDPNHLLKQICSGCYEESPLRSVSLESKELIRKCLTVDPDKRATAFELLDLALFRSDSISMKDHMTLLKCSSLLQYKNWRKKSKALDAVRGVASMIISQRRQQHGPKRLNASDQEAAELYADMMLHTAGTTHDVDDGGGLESFQILLYMQDRMIHLFQKRDRHKGGLVTCTERLHAFCQILKNRLDFNGDGLISRDEFVQGYSIWKMLVKKAESFQALERKASVIYQQ